MWTWVPCSRRRPAQLQTAPLSSNSFFTGKAVAETLATSGVTLGSGASASASLCGELSSSPLQPRSSTASSGSVPAVWVADLTEEARAHERRRENFILSANEALRAVCGPDARLVKACSVGGRMVFVVDGAVRESVRDQIFGCLQTDAFRKTEFARPDTREFRHHVVEYSLDKLIRTELFLSVSRLVDVFFCSQQEAPLEVYRIYTNAVMFGDAAFVHRDSCEPEHVTALLYPNPEWASELGGETLFYNENGEIAEAVEPRPGRVVLFRGCILHKGAPPSRLFWDTRYTTAFKFAAEDVVKSPPESPSGSSQPPPAKADGDGEVSEGSAELER